MPDLPLEMGGVRVLDIKKCESKKRRSGWAFGFIFVLLLVYFARDVFLRNSRVFPAEIFALLVLACVFIYVDFRCVSIKLEILKKIHKTY